MLSCLLLTACAAAVANPAHPSRSVDLAGILRMQPQGTSVRLLPGAPPNLSSLHFVNAQDGWAGGQGIILATSDGGRSWHRQYLGAGTVSGFSFLSPALGFAATSAGLLKTADGKTWSRVDDQSLDQVQFVNASVGFALEGQRYSLTQNLFASSDGGMSWRSLAIGPVSQACFFGPQVGIAALPDRIGGTLTMKRTTDGGANWSTVLSVANAVPEQLQCTQDGGAWLVAGGQAGMSQQSYSVFRSTNEGASWKVVLAATTEDGPGPGNSVGAPKGPGSSPGSIGAVDRSAAVMTGTCEACNAGTASFSTTTDGGASWSPATRPIPLQVASPTILDMLTAQAGWLLSSPGPGESQIQETMDGGAAWHTILLAGPTKPTASTAFVNARVGYGIGKTGDPIAVLRTQDGGRGWRKVGELPPRAVGVYGLGAAGTATLVAPTLHSALYKSTDGGRTWVTLPGKGLPAFDAISFATSMTGCASVGSPQFGADYTTRDGGKTWRRAPMKGVPAAVCAVSRTDPALAKTAMRLIDRLAPIDALTPAYFLSTVATGGGSLWIVVANTPHSRLYILAPNETPRVVHWPDEEINVSSMSPVSAREAYVTTYDGRLLLTRDAGAHWTQIP